MGQKKNPQPSTLYPKPYTLKPKPSQVKGQGGFFNLQISTPAAIGLGVAGKKIKS
jgi:hypothetical protein